MPLESVSLEDLHAALGETADAKPAVRLLAAIVYKNGPSVPTIASWLDRRPETIYRWFERMETEPLESAIRDRNRPGRPRKLDHAERAAFRSAVAGQPSDAGFAATEWTPDLARRFIEREFGVSYSRRHVRRLLAELEATE